MRDMRARVGKRLGAVLGILLAVVAIALAIAPTRAYAADVDYSFKVTGVPYDGTYGVYKTPGEKLSMKARLYKTDMETWETTAVKSVTYKWTVDAKLKSKTTVRGGNILVKKLPSKKCTYKYTLKAYNSKGKLLYKKAFKIYIMKKPAISITMRTFKASGGIASNNATTVKVGARMNLEMKKASFGWDNNTKTCFYTWKVENTKTGETAAWSKKRGSFGTNDIIEGDPIAGGATPFLMGSFKKAGTYKITATLYHSNKKIATATKTITVK